MKLLITFSFLLLSLVTTAQNKLLVYTSDIDHFWTAYDSARTTTDTLKQRQFFQQLYVDRASEGLQAFMRIRDYSAPLYVKLINQYPRFWASIRKNTLIVKEHVPAIEKSVARFRYVYPELRPAFIYFTVGGLRSGGTLAGDKVLLGSEIAMGDSLTDASELSTWLQGVFRTKKTANPVNISLHEYVHTQQISSNGNSLLGLSVGEGCADFIAELVTGESNKSLYMQYGLAHEAELKARFKLALISKPTNEWLYGGDNTAHPDLGYFMGYRICEAYYKQAQDKKAAIKDMIQLDCSNTDTVLNFLQQSGYYNKLPKKADLLREFDYKQPLVTGMYPAINNTADSVSAATTQITFYFSAVMNNSFSLSHSTDKSAAYPVTGVAGWSADRRSFTVKLALKPVTTYEFVITGQSFLSADGYPVKPLTVRFVTR